MLSANTVLSTDSVVHKQRCPQTVLSANRVVPSGFFCLLLTLTVILVSPRSAPICNRLCHSLVNRLHDKFHSSPESAETWTLAQSTIFVAIVVADTAASTTRDKLTTGGGETSDVLCVRLGCGVVVVFVVVFVFSLTLKKYKIQDLQSVYVCACVCARARGVRACVHA